jgi:hypothetical protein
VTGTVKTADGGLLGVGASDGYSEDGGWWTTGCRS